MFSKEEASLGCISFENRPHLRKTRSLPSYHDLDSVPSFPSYQPVASIIPPSVNPETTSAPSGNISANVAPPKENQEVQSQTGPMDNESTVFGSVDPTKSSEAQRSRDTHPHISLPPAKEKTVTLPLAAARSDNLIFNLPVVSPVVGPSAARPPPSPSLRASAPSLRRLRSPIQKIRRYLSNRTL